MGHNKLMKTCFFWIIHSDTCNLCMSLQISPQRLRKLRNETMYLFIHDLSNEWPILNQAITIPESQKTISLFREKKMHYFQHIWIISNHRIQLYWSPPQIWSRSPIHTLINLSEMMQSVDWLKLIRKREVTQPIFYTH